MTTKLMPYFAYDTAPVQAWMEDQAAKGRFFRKSYGGLFGECDEGEPRTVRYRLEPLCRNEKSPEEDHKKLCRAMGWEYVCTMGRFHVWRCDDPEAPEFYTEPEAQAEAYRYLLRQDRKMRWIFLGEVAVFLAVIFWLASITDGYLAQLAGSSDPLWIFLSCFGVYAVALGHSLLQTISLRRFLRRLREGLPQPRRKSYGKGLCMTVALTGLLGMLLAGYIGRLCQPQSRPFIPIEELEEPVPFVPLACAAEDLERNVEALPVDNWLTRKQWWIIDEWRSHDFHRIEYWSETRYYQMRLPFMGKALAESCLKRYKARGTEAEPVSAPGLDGGYYGTYWEDFQFLVIWQGSQVLEIFGSSPELLTDHLAEYAAVLEAFQ